jgi:hypothetical protein
MSSNVIVKHLLYKSYCLSCEGDSLKNNVVVTQSCQFVPAIKIGGFIRHNFVFR